MRLAAAGSSTHLVGGVDDAFLAQRLQRFQTSAAGMDEERLAVLSIQSAGLDTEVLFQAVRGD